MKKKVSFIVILIICILGFFTCQVNAVKKTGLKIDLYSNTSYDRTGSADILKELKTNFGYTRKQYKR